jgi:hypothetical protein
LVDDVGINAVGEEEEGGSGFAVGVAPSSSRPSTVDWGVATKIGEIDSGTSGGAGSPTGASKTGGSPVAGDVPSSAHTFHSKNEAYEVFKRNAGRSLVVDLDDAKSAMRTSRSSLIVARDALNESKDKIASLSRVLAEKKDARKNITSVADIANAGLTADDTIVDEEEYRFIVDVRNEKRTYRELMAVYTLAKGEFDDIANELVSAKRALLSSFDEWFAVVKEDGGGMIGEIEDFLDPGEAFQRLEQSRIQESEPGSLAFFNANKTMRKRVGQSGGQLRRTIRSKRATK